jgi:hypothetical protein
MAVKILKEIAQECAQKYDLLYVRVVHSVSIEPVT